MQIDWSYIQSHWDWAGHMVEALVMASVVAVLVRVLFTWRFSIIVGLAFAIGHFHGREKRDFEVSVKMKPPHLDGYLMWNWNWDQATDFWPAAIMCLVLIILILRWKSP
ncbi:hypothetical protein [Rhizobium sp. LC145]|uniref:hypothetical protein n=1 Tax=Rhizobium sp. LC145 TaxID=1120688 RepID=UPI00062A1964|nr:hypothetical protein [Rhizobium sp. LC145]KKX28207.1 membrane protein [Rhizobium sp. LC145]TKT46203.1 hypothetical protein FDR95_23280 [Rhizobiaceae bacterium LC148]